VKYIAIAAYKCHISGKDTGNREISVFIYNSRSPKDVINKIKKRGSHKYKNECGENVRWELIDVLSVAKYCEDTINDEIAGCTIRKDELYGKSGSRD
jgi:hypothetical protein